MEKNIAQEPLLEKSEQIIKEKKKKYIEMLEKDIYRESSFLSKLFFIWIFPILKIANLEPLSFKDLGNLSEDNNSKYYLDDLNKVWHNKKYKNKKCCPLLSTILRVNSSRLILMTIFSFFTLSLDLIIIVLLREYVMYFQKKADPNLTNEDSLINLPLYLLGPTLLLTKLVYIFISRQNQMVQSIVGFKSGIELSSLIYEKLLRVGAKSKALFTEGEITNFIQIDSQMMSDMLLYAPMALLTPLQFGGYVYLLLQYLGISFLFGLGVIILCFIIIGILQSKYVHYEESLMTSRDERMRITSQTINVLKILKLYAWETEFHKKINEKRKIEISKFTKILNLDVFLIFLFWSIPIFAFVAALGGYQIFESKMSIANIIASITIFMYMGDYLWMLPMFVSGLLDTLVAMRRIQKLLFQNDIDDSIILQHENSLITNECAINIKNAYFGWSNIENYKSIINEETINNTSVNEINKVEDELGEEQDNISNTVNNKTKRNKNFILQDIDLDITKGKIIGIIGEVGSGKSSLLQAILNNMELLNKNENDPNSRPEIIINGTISFVSQNSWIMNETLRNNITFFKEYDEKKFEHIIKICELESDLETLTGGDLTEIGEKGINLSGGQKTRVAIARAIYTDSDIYIFDDPLSSLDADVGMKIFNNVIMTYLKNKTVIIVTHALQYIDFMDRLFYMEKGKIIWKGTHSEILTQSFFEGFKEKIQKVLKIKPEILETCKLIENIEETDIKPKEKHNTVKRITQDERKEEGKVKWSIYFKYFTYMGGILVLILMLLMNFIWQALRISSNIWLTDWTMVKDLTKSENLNHYAIYSILGLSSNICIFIRVYVVTRGMIILNKDLHDTMISKLLMAPINLFHDTIPKGQILNRLSKDLQSISYSGFNYGSFLWSSFYVLGGIFVCALFEPWSLVFIPVALLFGILLTRFYINSGRDLNRLEGMSRSPILSQFSETILGVTTIRAFKYQENFKRKLHLFLDDLIKIKFYANGANQWFGLCLDMIFYLFLLFIVLLSLLFEDRFNPQSLGLIIGNTIFLSETLDYLFLQMVEFEKSLVSLERCDEYTNIVQEKPYTKENDLELEQSSWPNNGNIKFTDFSVKYRPDTDIILKKLNFEILKGEKIGVVGRTGSGKSTLCLCLFRILEPYEGTIYIDDVDITQIGLKLLRSSLTIIPQDPALIEGTLKFNVDPIGIYNDDEIINALENVGLSYLVREHHEKDEKEESNGLSMKIIENGDNLSVGEKQLICIARAILRKSKIVVMDEATSSIDIKTEALIQKAITSVLKHSTVITIAHRIKTIIGYDRIMVLSNGEIIEFESPSNLINNKDSSFYQLYAKSNI